MFDTRHLLLALALVAMVVLLPALPSLPEPATGAADETEFSDSPHGRVLAAVHDLNTTDYSYSLGDPTVQEWNPVVRVRVEQDETELRVTTRALRTAGQSSGSVRDTSGLYAHRSLVWRRSVGTTKWRFEGGAFDYCERATPVDGPRLRAAEYTVLNASVANTTVRYDQPIIDEGTTASEGSAVVSLDENGHLDWITETRRREGESDPGRIELRVGNYSTATVEQPPLPFSLEAEIEKRLAVVFGPHVDCG